MPDPSTELGVYDGAGMAPPVQGTRYGGTRAGTLKLAQRVEEAFTGFFERQVVSQGLDDGRSEERRVG